MELDKRIKEGKRPLTCFDVKEAIQFIGKECYLSNNMGCFSVLNCGVENKEIKKAELTNISNSAPCYEIPGFYYDFCLPCEWVKPEEPEKKYRPFDIKEFIKKYSVGSVFLIRRKREEMTETCVQYVGYKIFQQKIYLGITDFTLDELFENFEICINGKWQPFGVIDEEGAKE